jgi:hypothetical protein
MMAIPDNLKYLIEALRTPASGAQTDVQSGSNPGTRTSNANLAPLEQRRDGYRQYLNEFRGGSQEGDPLSYEDWLSQEK